MGEILWYSYDVAADLSKMGKRERAGAEKPELVTIVLVRYGQVSDSARDVDSDYLIFCSERA